MAYKTICLIFVMLNAKITVILKVSNYLSKYCVLLEIDFQTHCINNSLHLAQKLMLRYLSTDIICSEKRTVFREHSSRKTVSFEEQIMSKDKYLSIFSPQMETIMLIILQIFYATRAVLKIGGYINNSRHLARKYARIFVRRHYLFREENSFPRAQLEENCELRGTDNVQGEIS